MSAKTLLNIITVIGFIIFVVGFSLSLAGIDSTNEKKSKKLFLIGMGLMTISGMGVCLAIDYLR